MDTRKTIVICCSAAFYEHANQIADELQKLGFKAVVPITATRMKERGDYDLAKVKTWYKKPEDFPKKVELATGHLDKVAAGDAILIVNDNKPGKPNYIGPNTLMEWGLAYYLRKPVFILNDVGRDHFAYEEVHGLTTAVLGGDLKNIKL